jgi:hypothetical protein
MKFFGSCRKERKTLMQTYTPLLRDDIFVPIGSSTEHVTTNLFVDVYTYEVMNWGYISALKNKIK